MRFGNRAPRVARTLVGVLCLAGVVTLGVVVAPPDAGADLPRREVWVLDMVRDVRAVTHGGALGIGLVPAGIRPLEGGGEANLALITTLTDRTGKVLGIASELEEFPGAEKVPGKPWKTTWTLLLNGRGALFVEALEAMPAVHRPAFETAHAGREWRGRLEGATTVGPQADGRGRIVGGTGEFAGARGSVEEYAVLTRMTPDGVMEGHIELRVEFDPAAAGR